MKPTKRHATIMRGARLGLVLILAGAGQLLAASPSNAASHGSLECIHASGEWRVYLPAANARDGAYWSQFVHRFVGNPNFFGATEWIYSQEWFWGDFQTAWFWTPAGGIRQLPSNTWAYSGTYNSGHLIVWEYQYYPATGALNWEKVGECDIYQWTPFTPFSL